MLVSGFVAVPFIRSVSAQTNTVIKTVSMGAVPIGVAFDSANGDIHVTDAGSSALVPGNVSVIDGSTNKMVANITVGLEPSGVAFDSANGDAYVTNSGSNTVSVIATSPETIPLWPWVILAIPAIMVAFAVANLLRGRPSKKTHTRST